MTAIAIDLRSDTVTQPTPNLRRAMAEAPVGDDVYGDDPSVNQLEERVADLLGKEAAVFMPSGTMTNQVALRLHTEPGDEIILEAEAHIYYYEAGALAALAGLMVRLIAGDRGLITADDLRRALRPANLHYPPTKLICLENTHNRGGGSIFPLEAIREIAALSREHRLALHLDGARLWNACEATGIAPADYAAPFDTASVCFSKGLGAPVGSALAGSREAMQRARRLRKQLGGGMRQAGIVAAGALYALEHQRDRLGEDRENAQWLARALAAIDGIELNPAEVETNIVRFRTRAIAAPELERQLREAGIAILATGPDLLRAVTNLMVTREQIEQVPARVAAILEASGSPVGTSLSTSHPGSIGAGLV